VIFWLGFGFGFGFFVGYGVGSHLATRRAIRGNDETSARIVARTDWSVPGQTWVSEPLAADTLIHPSTGEPYPSRGSE
jgi:hypothetical protein